MLPGRYTRETSRFRLSAIPYGLIAIALVVVPCRGQNKKTVTLPASSPTNHRSSSPDKRLPANHSQGNYISPDHKYVAHIQGGEGDTADLWICQAPLSGQSLSLKHALVPHVDDTFGLVWIPGRPHTLVFATTGMYGKASLSLWRGGTHLDELVPVKHPNKEVFDLNSVSADGHTIYYSHGTVDQIESQYQHRHLTLPR